MPGPTPAPEELDLVNNRSNLVLRLYTNDIVPSVGLGLGDFVEPDFDGYEEKNPAGFGAPEGEDPEVIADMKAPPVTFTKAAGSKGSIVRGWFLVLITTAGPFFAGYKPFPKPFSMLAEGDTFTFQPKARVENIVLPTE